MADGARSARTLEGLAGRLSAASIRRYANPNTLFDWPERPDRERFAFSPALSALSSHPVYVELSDEQRWRLHLHEAAHFFSLNVAGERELMIGLARRLHVGALAPVSGYLQHFLHEENVHTAVFSRFCRSYATLYPDRQVPLGSPGLPGEDDVVFFARVVVFEEVANYFNVTIGRDDSVWSLSRDINAYHAQDEARHIAFGRVALGELWARFAPAWGDEGRARVSSYIERYLEATLRSYVDPSVFRAAGVPGRALALRDEVLGSPQRAALHEAASRRARESLRFAEVLS
ncbi:MAG: hypothetical protein HOW73_19535 [Polyangiaceae bacterium]|nr:hypothetical protein [Polyangiaceae bacterium]